MLTTAIWSALTVRQFDRSDVRAAREKAEQIGIDADMEDTIARYNGDKEAERILDIVSGAAMANQERTAA